MFICILTSRTFFLHFIILAREGKPEMKKSKILFAFKNTFFTDEVYGDQFSQDNLQVLRLVLCQWDQVLVVELSKQQVQFL